MASNNNLPPIPKSVREEQEARQQQYEEYWESFYNQQDASAYFFALTDQELDDILSHAPGQNSSEQEIVGDPMVRK